MIIDFIPRKTYAIVSAYIDDKITTVVAGIHLTGPYRAKLFYPKVNPFGGSRHITLHLDNRTGLDEYNHELRVYRTSVKAEILENTAGSSLIEFEEYELVYGANVVEKYKKPRFEYAVEDRDEIALPLSDMGSDPNFEDGEFDNKLGVLITRGPDRPHTTVMAFLSNHDDDIFLISHSGTLKSRNLARDFRCGFAIDHRANYHFEKHYEWNYTIIEGEASIIGRDREIFEIIREEFIRKNPWEMVFFSDPKIQLYHIKPKQIICPEEYAKKRHRER